MKALNIEPSEFSPKITFDADNNKFEVEGVSRPENPTEFYQPVIDWLDAYVENPNDATTVNFRFDYFNTSSLKFFLIILSKFKDVEEAGKEVNINWHYDEEDDEMLEVGENLEELSELEFKYLEIEE
jgi:hypothetical protein